MQGDKEEERPRVKEKRRVGEQRASTVGEEVDSRLQDKILKDKAYEE